MPDRGRRGGIAIRFKGELKTARLAVLVLMALLFTGLAPLPPVQATVLTAMFPVQGPVGTAVTIMEIIDLFRDARGRTLIAESVPGRLDHIAATDTLLSPDGIVWSRAGA